jgi:hypothetical protein
MRPRRPDARQKEGGWDMAIVTNIPNSQRHDALIAEFREKYTPTLDRWVSVRFAAICLIGKSAGEQDLLMASLLFHYFEDVPDEMPSLDDTQAWAAYSVKLLLQALIDDGSDGNKLRFAAAKTWKAMMAEMFDPNPRGYHSVDKEFKPIPSPHLIRTLRARAGEIPETPSCGRKTSVGKGVASYS